MAVCYCPPVFAYQGVCFYAGNDSMSACQQTSVAEGWMKGRSSTPKQRALCQCCLDWLVGEGLAECMPLRSDPPLPPHPPCKLLVAGRALALVTSPYAVPRTAAYGEDAAELGSCYYGNNLQLASHCRQLAWTAVCMIGKRASPKNRLVCNVCTAWLLEEDLALMLSPRSLSIRSAHGPLQIFNVAKDIWTT